MERMNLSLASSSNFVFFRYPSSCAPVKLSNSPSRRCKRFFKPWIRTVPSTASIRASANSRRPVSRLTKAEWFASISSSGSSKETTSVGVNPPSSVPPPPSFVGIPLFWIGIGVGVSALFSLGAVFLKKHAMQQGFKTLTSQMTTQNSQLNNPVLSPEAPFPFSVPSPSGSATQPSPLVSQSEMSTTQPSPFVSQAEVTVDVSATKDEAAPPSDFKDGIKTDKESKKFAFVDVSHEETQEEILNESYEEVGERISTEASQLNEKTSENEMTYNPITTGASEEVQSTNVSCEETQEESFEVRGGSSTEASQLYEKASQNEMAYNQIPGASEEFQSTKTQEERPFESYEEVREGSSIEASQLYEKASQNEMASNHAPGTSEEFQSTKTQEERPFESYKEVRKGSSTEALYEKASQNEIPYNPVTSASEEFQSTKKSGSILSVEAVEKMMEDPTVQKMVYPHLPEEMRNPATFKWMLQNPQYRQQLEGMLNNLSESSQWDGRLMDSLKNFDLNSPEVKQQFDQIGLSPEQVISRIMANPEIAMAFENPRVQAAIMDCSQNPLSIAKYQNDKEVMDVFNKTSQLFQGVSG